MATENSRVNIFINDTQAQEAYKNHSEAIKKLRDGYSKLERGTDEWLKRTAEINKAEAEFAKFVRTVDLTSLSLKELTALQAQLNSKVKSMNPNDAGYKEMLGALGAVRTRYQQVQAEISNVGKVTKEVADENKSFLDKAADGFNKYFGVIAAGTAALSGVVFSAKKMLDLANEFEDRLANLSSLTGLVGEDLNWLKDQATEMSQSVVNGNIKITKSAQDIVDAYTIVGSQRPELLKNKEALNEVTKQALILAEAAKIDLVDATKAVTTSMNQFGLEADQSGRIINVLGAGSKEGAADISYLNEALEKSGTAGKAANISFEQQVAMIETLGPKFSSAEKAGTQLRNVLLKMQGMKDEFNPAIMGMKTSLDNMAASQLNITQLTEMFGQENIIAIQTLMEGKEQYAAFEKAVTNTAVAEEQAAINTNTRKASLQQARNELENNARMLGEKLAPVATMSVNIFSTLVKTLTALPRIIRENQGLLIALAGATLIYFQRTIATTIAEKGLAVAMAIKNGFMATGRTLALAMSFSYNTLTGNTNRAAAAQRAMGASFMMTPFGWVVAGIMAVVGAIKLYDANSERTVNINRIKVSLDKDLAASTERLKNIQEKYNETVAKWNTLSIEQQEIERKGLIQSLQAEEIELKKEKAKRDDLLVASTSVSAWDMMWNNITTGGNVSAAAMKNVSTAIENGKEKTAEADQTIKTLSDTIKGLNSDLSAMKTAVELEADANKITTDTIAGMQAKVQAYQKALNAAKIGSADFTRIQKDLSYATAMLNKHLSAGPGDEAKKLQDKLKKDYQDLVAELKKIDEDLEMSKLSGHERELKEVELKYKKLRDRARGHLKEQQEIDRLEREARNVITTKMLDESIAAANKDTKNKIENIKKEWEELKQKHEKEEEAMWKEQEALDEIEVKNAQRSKDEKKITEAKIAQINTRMAHELEGVKAGSAQEVLIRKKAQEEIDGVYADALAKRKELEKQATDMAIDAAGNIAGAISQINANKRDAENSRQLSALERQKDKELSSQKLTATQKAVIEKKYHDQEAAIKKRAWERQRSADLNTAYINAALALTKTFATYGFTPAAAIAAAGQAIVSGSQIAIIATRPVPEFSGGGYTGSGYGRADASGHRPAGIVHAYEYVVPAHIANSPRMLPIINMLESIRTRGYAAGGYVSPQPGAAGATAPPASGTDNGRNEQLNRELLAAINLLNAHLAAGIKAVALVGDDAIRDIEERIEEFDTARLDSSS